MFLFRFSRRKNALQSSNLSKGFIFISYFAISHLNLPEGSYGNGRGTEKVSIIAAFLRKAGPSLLRWPEGKTRRGRALAKRGGKLEDSPSLVRTRVLGLLLLL